MDQTVEHERMDLSVTADFIQHLKDHDDSSFSLLYDSYGEKIYNLAYRMTGDIEDATDITQETFFQVFRHIEAFREESHLFTWIFTIARNECLKLLAGRRRTSFSSFEEMIQSARQVKSPDGLSETDRQYLIDQIKEGCLTGLIRCLSIDQRTAFILSVLLKIEIEDVAAIMNRSEGAVRVLVHRARTNIKMFLCKNCSQYNPANHCHCEDLIGFSLKKDWISIKDNSETQNSPPNTRQLEKEISEFALTMDYYSRLSLKTAPKNSQQIVTEIMKSKDWMIFHKNGV